VPHVAALACGLAHSAIVTESGLLFSAEKNDQKMTEN
jgi:hypothetical protein